MDGSSRDFGLSRTASNIISNIILFAADILISLWYTPYLVRKVGSELFGFVPLANSLTGFLGIITYSLNISTGRYITIELEKGEEEGANQVFNSALIGTMLLVSATIPIGAALTVLAPYLFSIPPGTEREVQYLFIGVIAAFYLSMLRINFSVATFARNRFDLRNIVTFLARLGQIALIVFLFNWDRPSIIYVGLGALLAAALGFIGDYVLWRRLLPTLKIKLKSFRKKVLEPFFQTGSWTFLYQIGFILFLNTDMLVANRTLDLSLVGMYGALLVIPKNLRVMSMAIGGVWGPSILSKYSQSDYRGMNSIVELSIKVIGMAMALPIGLLVGLAGPFLALWLGPSFASMSWVFILMIFHLAVNLIVGPFFNVQVSLNKLKLPAIVAFCLGLTNLFLTIVFARLFGVIGIAIAGALAQTLYYAIFSPAYTARLMNFAWWRYLIQFLPILVATFGVAALSYAITLLISLSSLAHIFIVGLFISVAYLLVVYRFGLAKAEKDAVKTYALRLFEGSGGFRWRPFRQRDR
jgi:O-antigen/teichoic acid export membrane protein